MTPTSLITAKARDRSPTAPSLTTPTVGDGYAVGVPSLLRVETPGLGASLALKQAVDFGLAGIILL